MLIVDAHAHISNTDYGNRELYLTLLQQAGIDQGVVVPGGMLDVRRMTDYITGKSKPENTIPDNDYVQESCQAAPGLHGFVCVNPHDPQAPEVLEQALRRGSRGLKLSPMTHEFSFASKAVEVLADLCGQYHCPLYTHVQFSPGASTTRLAHLARKFPQTRFILGHMGFGPSDREALEAAIELDNLYLETSCGNYLFIEQAVQRAGAEKVIFGSEFPLSHPAAELHKIMLLDISDDDREKILGGTTGLMTQEEGMLVGSTSSGGIFVCSETHYLPYMNLRPFRVNAGAIHSYIWMPGNMAEYLSDLQVGSKVLCVNIHGQVRELTVGRVKIEMRPLLLIKGVAAGTELNVMVQDDWHIRLMGADGKPKNASLIRPGDELLAHVCESGRHVGIKVTETILEK